MIVDTLTIIPLTAAHSQQYRDLRLEALINDPKSFLSTLETEKQKSESFFAFELRHAQSEPIFGYFGVLLNNHLIGYAQLEKSYLPKQRHIAFLYNLYISIQHRRHGLGKQLLTHLITELREKTEVERVFLTCNGQNQTALDFYKQFGFVQCGLKPKSVLWEGEYDDEVELMYELEKKR